MKKRQFLSPLALSLAALLTTTQLAGATSTPQSLTTELAAPQVSENSEIQTNDFVLKPAGSFQVADDDSPGHASHSSHASHASHSSHYSSGY